LKKNSWIYIVIGCILVGVLGFYLVDYQYNSQKAISKGKEPDIKVSTTKKAEMEIKETEERVEQKDIYTYRNGFKDPFAGYQTQTINPAKTIERTVSRATIESKSVEVYTPESLKARFPYVLRGIIGNNSNRLAIMEKDGNSGIYRQGERIGDYKIRQISDQGVKLAIYDITFIIEIRGGSGGN